MYLKQNQTFGDFGYWQFVVGALQQIGYAVAAGTTYSAQKKYLKKEGHTQQLSHKSQMDLKQQELASKQGLLLKKGETELYRDQRIKKLVIITIMTLVAVTVIGLGSYLVLSGGSDE